MKGPAAQSYSSNSSGDTVHQIIQGDALAILPTIPAGTAGLEARGYIGIELSSHYADVVRRRLAEAVDVEAAIERVTP